MKSVLVCLLFCLISCYVVKSDILILGKAGVGKSYLINALLGNDLAFESGTDDIGTTKLNGYNISGVKLYDSPGLFDTGSDPEKVIKHYIEQAKPSLILVCYDASERRLTNQDKLLVTALNNSSPGIMNKTVFVLTQLNRACSGLTYEDCTDIIVSKFVTLKTFGAIHYTYAGDKKNCAFYEKDNCIIKWMDNVWNKIITNWEMNIGSVITIAKVAKSVNYNSPGGYALKESASKRDNDCISVYSVLGGIRAKDLIPGDIIEQNGKFVKVLFIYRHADIGTMYKLTIQSKVTNKMEEVTISGEHYIPVPNKGYIKTKDVIVDDYVLNIEMVEDYGLYLVTELEDLYIGSIPISTYVWNYDIMRLLHIPFRFILSMVY